VRPYVRPLATTEIPVAKTVEIGFTYLQDRDNTDYAKVFQDDESVNDPSNLPSTYYVRDGLSAWGVDMGVTVVNNSMLRLTAYTQYNKLNKIDSDSLQARQLELAIANPEQADLINGYKAGTGFSFGVHAGINFVANIFNLDVRLERLWFSDYYQPQFFNAIYELNKDAKIESLLTTTSLTGTFGALTGTIINKVRLGGGLLLPDNVSEQNPAYIYLTLDANELIDGWIIQGS
jgi:hypothetical protein